MKRKNKIGIVGLAFVAVVAFFFLAPVFFWFNAYNPLAQVVGVPQPTTPSPLFSVYRSLGCMTLGLGYTLRYGPAYPQFDLRFTCEAGPIPQ